MRQSFPRLARLRRRVARSVAALVAVAACRTGDAPAASGPANPPPPADFVLAAGDSAFWVTSAAGTVRVRGAPLELARVGGRFYELYVTDDDRSFEDAEFVGQRVYRRDLLRGDSVLVYEDSTVPRLAGEYQRRHPDQRPLAPDAEPGDDPAWSAVATLDLTAVHGPFVSFDAHTDVQRDDAPAWHASRRGVIDLRGGGAVALATVVGDSARLPDVLRDRGQVLRAALDSVRGNRSDEGRRAAALLSLYRMEPDGFALTTLDGAPAVAYALTGSGGGDAGHLLPLAPVRIGEPSWWPDVASTLPVRSVGGLRQVWRHGKYEVVVRFDSTADAGRLILRDSTSREWTVGRVPAPATRIFWLDAPAIDAPSRQALARAFEESALYDEAVRAAAWHRGAAPLARSARSHRPRPHHARPSRSPLAAPHA